MNPEAIEWLENLTPEERGQHFSMCNHYGSTRGGLGLFSLKQDHEGESDLDGGRCGFCLGLKNLVVIS